MRPILFTVGGSEIQSYGILLGVALICGYLITLGLARRDTLPTEPLGTIYVAGVVGALFAGRVGWILQHPDAFDGAGSLFTLQAGTFAPFFAIVVGLAFTAVLVNRRKIPVVAWLDVAAPAFAVGVCLERLGALLAGSASGVYAPEVAWAIRYPMESPVFADHAARLGNLMPPGATESLPVHPAPIYGLALGLVGVVLVLHQRRHRRFSGQVFLRYAGYYVLTRSFVEEWFRADAESAVVGPLNGGQVGAIVALVLLAVVHRTRAGASEPLRAWEGGVWSPKEKKGPARKRPDKSTKRRKKG